MPKYHIFVTRCIGEVTADSNAQAIEIAEKTLDMDTPTLCHSCSEEWDVGDLHDEIEADEVREPKGRESKC